MATGASTADLALILVDAQSGLTRADSAGTRSSCRRVGVRHIALVVNKMDKVGWSEDAFRAIEREFRGYAGELGVETTWSAFRPPRAAATTSSSRSSAHGLVSRPDRCSNISKTVDVAKPRAAA